jgi:hypothetical protein
MVGLHLFDVDVCRRQAVENAPLCLRETIEERGC